MPKLVVNAICFVFKHFWAFLSAWFFILLLVNDYRLTQVKQEYKDHIETTEFAIKDMNIKWQTKMNTAEKEFNEKVAQLNADNTVLIDRANGLSEQLSKAQSKWVTASSESKTEYTNTLSNVFKQCVAEYKDLAVKADGHALDAIRLKQAWPTTDEPP